MHRNIYILFFTGFMDLFAVSMTVPLLINHYKNLGASPFLAGILGATYGFLQFFSGPFMGTCSDCYGRKYILQICFALCAMSYFILSVSGNLFFVFLSRIPTGCFKHTQDLSRSLLAVSVKSEERVKLLSRFNAVSNTGFIIGPLIGGYLVESVLGFHYVAAISSFLFFINFVIVTIFLEDNARAKFERVDPLSSFMNSFTLGLISQVWIILSIRFLMSFAAFMKSYNPVSSHVPSKAGMIMSFSGVVMAISNFLVGPIMSLYHGNDRRLLVHVSTIQGTSILLLTFLPDTIYQLLFNIPYNIANSLTKVTATNLTFEIAKKKNMGLVMGLGGSTIAMGRFLAPIVGGLSEELCGYGPGVVGATSSFTCAILICFAVPYKRKK